MGITIDNTIFNTEIEIYSTFRRVCVHCGVKAVGVIQAREIFCHGANYKFKVRNICKRCEIMRKLKLLKYVVGEYLLLREKPRVCVLCSSTENLDTRVRNAEKETCSICRARQYLAIKQLAKTQLTSKDHYMDILSSFGLHQDIFTLQIRINGFSNKYIANVKQTSGYTRIINE